MPYTTALMRSMEKSRRKAIRRLNARKKVSVSEIPWWQWKEMRYPRSGEWRPQQAMLFS